MDNPKDKDPQSTKQELEKPEHIKPEVVAIYQEKDLEKEFANVYGATFVDLFGP
jgi:hypothetical protein